MTCSKIHGANGRLRRQTWSNDSKASAPSTVHVVHAMEQKSRSLCGRECYTKRVVPSHGEHGLLTEAVARTGIVLLYVGQYP